MSQSNFRPDIEDSEATSLTPGGRTQRSKAIGQKFSVPLWSQSNKVLLASVLLLVVFGSLRIGTFSIVPFMHDMNAAGDKVTVALFHRNRYYGVQCADDKRINETSDDTSDLRVGSYYVPYDSKYTHEINNRTDRTDKVYPTSTGKYLYRDHNHKSGKCNTMRYRHSQTNHLADNTLHPFRGVTKIVPAEASDSETRIVFVANAGYVGARTNQLYSSIVKNCGAFKPEDEYQQKKDQDRTHLLVFLGGMHNVPMNKRHSVQDHLDVFGYTAASTPPLHTLLEQMPVMHVFNQRDYTRGDRTDTEEGEEDSAVKAHKHLFGDEAYQKYGGVVVIPLHTVGEDLDSTSFLTLNKTLDTIETTYTTPGNEGGNMLLHTLVLITSAEWNTPPAQCEDKLCQGLDATKTKLEIITALYTFHIKNNVKVIVVASASDPHDDTKSLNLTNKETKVFGTVIQVGAVSAWDSEEHKVGGSYTVVTVNNTLHKLEHIKGSRGFWPLLWPLLSLLCGGVYCALCCHYYGSHDYAVDLDGKLIKAIYFLGYPCLVYTLWMLTGSASVRLDSPWSWSVQLLAVAGTAVHCILLRACETKNKDKPIFFLRMVIILLCHSGFCSYAHFSARFRWNFGFNVISVLMFGTLFSAAGVFSTFVSSACAQQSSVTKQN